VINEKRELVNSTQFDAKTFVGLAKQAGVKYMVITPKHHDGFSMFDSECIPFNVVDAIPPKPFGQNEEGVVAFHPDRAQFQNLQGPGARYNSSKDCVGSWTSETAKVYWTFVIDNLENFMQQLR
jgi:hypothetical protein